MKSYEQPRLIRLYVLHKLYGFETRRGRAAWNLYTKTRAAMGVCQLTAPAELQRRLRAREWPFDGTVTHRNLERVC